MLTPTEDGIITVMIPAMTRTEDMVMSSALCTLLKSFAMMFVNN